MKLNVLAITTFSSDFEYNKVFDTRKKKMLDPSQKYMKNIFIGLAQNEVQLYHISIRPVSPSTHTKKIWRKEYCIENNITFCHIGFVNCGVLLYIWQLCVTLFETLKWITRNRGKKVVIIDPLIAHTALPVIFIAHLLNIRIVEIITDIPIQLDLIGKTKEKRIKKQLLRVYQLIAHLIAKKGDGYVFVTDSMAEYYVTRGKPWVRIEGCSIATSDHGRDAKAAINNTIVYSGGIHEKFGIFKLIEAFMLTDLPLHKLCIYGQGGEVGKIKTLAEASNGRVLYCGVVSVKEIMRIQKNACLLVNPRPTDELFTKYSFPSKLLEYMTSGTPVLTTRLLGIPEDYYSYLYFFNEETALAMAKKIEEIVLKPKEEIVEFGKTAKNYVMKTKNCTTQGKKLLNLINSL